MSTFTRMVRKSESSREPTRQPGMNRTFARCPERLEMKNTRAPYAGSLSAGADLAWQAGQSIPATLPRSSLATAQLANSGSVV